MSKFDVHKPLLVPPDSQSEIPWLQAVQQVRSLVDYDVAVGILGLVGRPPHMREVARETIARHLDIIWFKAVVSIETPENPPRRVHVTGRQLYFQRGLGPIKVQDEGP